MNFTATSLSDFTSLETKIITIFILGAVVMPPIILFGFIANITNIIIYLKLGVKDSISICFFLKACSDLVCVLMLVVTDTSILLSEMFREKWQVDGEDLCWLTIYYYQTFYDISQGITTFIAVQKCWCVALPFRFKDTFTTTRTTFFLTAITMLVFSFHMPILATQDMVEMFDPMRNTTLVRLWTSDARVAVYPVVGHMSLVFTTTCQVTVVFCLFILASGLRASSKFRNSTSIPNTERPSSELRATKMKSGKQLSKNDVADKKISLKQTTEVDEEKATNKVKEIHSPETADISSALRPVKNTSRKELQALKSATLVSVLFVVCNTFKLLDYYIVVSIPDYSPFGRFVNTYVVANIYRFTIEAFDISFNLLVYLKFNSRFRSTFYSGICFSDSKLSTTVAH